MRKIRRRRLLGGAALALLTMLGAATAADSQATRYYEDAVTRFNALDYRGAEIQLKNALQRDPSQLAAHLLMGRTQLALGHARAAEEALLAASRLGADPTLTALPLAQARNQLGEHKLVAEALQPNRYPTEMQADLWAELGKARLASGDPEGAALAFDEALGMQPLHREGLRGRVRLLLQGNRYAEAASAAAELLSAYPDDAEAWFLMGSTYHARGEFDGAAAHYQEARRLAPDHPKALFGQAMALAAGGQLTEAATLLERLCAARPLFVEAHYYRAKVLQQLGRTAEAKEALQQAAQIITAVSPSVLGDDTESLLLAARVALESGQHETALSYLTAFLQFRADDLEANRLLASVLRRMDKPVDASRLLTRLTAMHPDDPQLLIMLGDVSIDLHDYAAAERYYKSVLTQLQTDPAVLGRLGFSQLRQGDAQKAIQAFEQLAAVDPNSNLGASVLLTMLYLGEGQVAQAQEVAERLVAAQPGNPVARNLQATVTIAQGQRDAGRRMLQATLARHPTFRPARINLIKLDIAEGRYQDAADQLQALLQADPEDRLALRESARLALARNAKAEAVRQLERIRQLDPRAASETLDLAELYLAAERSDMALQLISELMRELPDNVAVKLSLARTHLARRELDAARGQLDDAARLATFNPRQLTAVAALQMRAGALAEAERNLRQALRERPGFTPAQLQLARVMARQRRYQEAATEIDQVLSREPRNTTAIGLLGDLRDRQGEADAAIAAYRRALALTESPEMMARLHDALVRAGRADEALAELQAWHVQHPDSPLIMRTLADRLQQRGDVEGSLQLYRRLAELQPQSALIHNNLANILLSARSDQALAAALRAYELAPEDAAVLDTLGWVLVQRGDLEGGLKHLREALSRNGGIPTIRYHLAVALEEDGNAGEAKTMLQQALEAEGFFPEREDARRRLMQLGAESL